LLRLLSCFVRFRHLLLPRVVAIAKMTARQAVATLPTAAATADSSEDEAEEEEEDAPAEDTTEATTEDAAPVPTGTLRMAFSTDVQTYDPVMTGVAQTPYLQPVYDTLLIWTSDGVKPRQAEAVRIIDASTYELDIRAGITFSDGATFDAAAVVASYERAMANEASPQTPFYSNIASITATSDMTVRFELVNPTTVFLEDLTWLPGMVTSPNATDLDTVPVGAGGWVLDTDSTRAGVQQDFVARTDGYWDPDSVLVERIKMRLLQEEASVNAKGTARST
jgi:ABC-type dipeptide transport system, periplasmic component